MDPILKNVAPDTVSKTLARHGAFGVANTGPALHSISVLKTILFEAVCLAFTADPKTHRCRNSG
jgi:hypothetical protein